MFLFCSIKVKGSRWTISRRARGVPTVIEIVATSVLVDVGENDLPGAGDFGCSRNSSLHCVKPTNPWVRLRLKRPSGRTPLGDDVRRDLVFDEGDTVAQLQLAFLQPL
jgi:hypothetical protein